MMNATSRREELAVRLRAIASDLSGMTPDNIPDDVSFLELGFDSLFLTQLSASYQRAFGVRITFRQLFTDLSTIAALSAFLDESLPSDTRPATSGIPSTPAIQTITSAPITLPRQQTVSEPDGAAQPAQPALRTVQRLGGTDLLATVLLQQMEIMAGQLRLLHGAPPEFEVPGGASSASNAAPAVATEAISMRDAAVRPSAPIQDSSHTPRTSIVPSARSKNTTTSAGFGPGQTGIADLPALPERQQKHLDSLIESYTRKTAGSKKRTQHYRHSLADPRTAAGFNRRWKEMVYPIWVERSQGSRLWDVDRNEYIDLLNGFGPNFLGHSPDYITRAIEDQLHRGFEIGPQTRLVGEVAEMICQLTGMERASFTCSGSEAVQAAMRLARTVTGRDKIVVFDRDYHGNFDQVLVRAANRPGALRTVPSAPGIPFQSVDDTWVLEYGTEESLSIIRTHARDLAAVIVEPVQSRRPELQPREFLSELRRITRESETLLVFDEVITGFRAAPGGAQEYFGIEADLATYGKIVGGGMPIGVVAGRSTVMDTFDGGYWQYGDDSFPGAGVTFFAGTFVRHPLAIAAAHATLTHLIKEGPELQKRVADRTGRFARQVNDLFQRHDLDIEMPHFCSQMYLRIREHGELANLLYFHLRLRGVHVLEGFPSYVTDAHTDADMTQLLRIFTESVESMVCDGLIGCPTPDLIERSPVPVMPASTSPRARADSKEEQPPSEAQRDMWVAAQMSNEASAASYGSNIIELIGDFNATALERAICLVIQRHESLRSTFSVGGGMVRIKPSMPTPFRVEDFSGLSGDLQDAEVARIMNEEVRQAFDLSTGPLFSFRLMKLSSHRHLLAFTAHMIVCDGWGFQVVLKEIGAAYSADIEGHEPSLEAPDQMRQYVSWQTSKEGTEDALRAENHWLAHFDTLPPPFELPGTGIRPPFRSFAASRETLSLGEAFCAELKRTAKRLKTTPFALFLTAYEVWLYRLSGLNDFVIAVPFAGQAGLGLNTMVGQCVQTLPFHIRISPEASFTDQLKVTNDLILDAQEHWNSSISATARRLDLPGDPSRLPLSSVMFNLDPPFNSIRFAGCACRVSSGPRWAFHYDLGFNIVDEGNAFVIECDYNTKLFEPAVISEWLVGFQSLLNGIFGDPQTPVFRLPMRKQTEDAQSYNSGVNTGDLTIDGLIAQRTKQTPTAPAVEFESRRLTYAELDRFATEIARSIKARGLDRNCLVGVYMNRSDRVAPALLGVLKAGCRFLHIDPLAIEANAAAFLSNPAPALLLTDDHGTAFLPPDLKIPILSFGDATSDTLDSVPLAGSSPDDPACICYTRGSGGSRRPVGLAHGAISGLLVAVTNTTSLGPGDAMLAITPGPLNNAALEILLPLVAGARVIVAPASVTTDMGALSGLIEKHQVTVMHAPPAIWRGLFGSGWKGNKRLKAICSGEVLDQDLAARLIGSCGAVWNLYGATEAGGWSIGGKALAAETQAGLPLGDTRVSIVDTRDQKVQVGVPGELLIGRVASGRSRDGRGETLHRTGDIARFRADGQIEILGRRRRASTLRRYPVDPQAVESVVLRHSLVADAAVMVRNDGGAEPQIILYVVAEKGGGTTDEMRSDLKRWLRARLPAYLGPSAVVPLTQLPRTTTGVLDESSFPPPRAADYKFAEDDYVAPRNEIEGRLARLWCETLKRDQISVRDNFFEIGGQSLLAVALFLRIEDEFSRRLPLVTLFSCPTIESLAILLSSEKEKAAWDSLVPIQPQGSKPPLFLVHGAGGNVLLYRNLAKHFARDYPLYGLQSRGLDSVSRPLTTIEEMADAYLAEVRAVQKTGPYHLGGYCLGGTIAYEMARILRSQGEEVRLVAMLDTYNFSRALKVSFRSFLAQKLKFHLANMAGMKPRELSRYVTEKASHLLRGELFHLKTSMPGSGDEGVGRATQGIELSIQALNDNAAETFIPKPYPGALAIFKPRFNYKFYPDPNMGWSDLALDGLDIVEVAVNPHSMLLDPCAEVLARQLKDRIDTLPLEQGLANATATKSPTSIPTRRAQNTRVELSV